MASLTLFRGLMGLENTSIKDARYNPVQGVLVISVEPFSRQRSRCGICRKTCPRYDAGQGVRQWRSLDHGVAMTFLQGPAPRVRCPAHGVRVAHVPWAAHGAGHTHSFDAQVAWLAIRLSKSAASELMRINWSTVGKIVKRVYSSAQAAALKAGHGDGLDGLVRIGIDEVSYKRGHKYLTVVVDHDTGRLVWAREGHDRATLAAFFALLGEQRCTQIAHVSADGARYIELEVTARCPAAVIGIDPFHVVKWANDALAKVRIEQWNAFRALKKHDPPKAVGGARKLQWLEGHDTAKAIRGSRYALWKNPENLTEKQQIKLEWIEANNPYLYRAYELKEALRSIFTMPLARAKVALEVWLAWAQRCRIAQFVELGRTIRRHQERILLSIEHGLSNGRVESVNNKIRVLTRIAYGFHDPHALIALAMLALGAHRPALPGRN